MRILVRHLWRQKVASLAVLVLAVALVVALMAPRLSPHDPAGVSLRERLKPPAWQAGGVRKFILGTDALGRDVLSRVIFGARVSLLVGATVVLISGTLGVMLGLAMGYVGGSVDGLLMRLGEVQLALPFILLVLTVMAVLGGGLVNMILVLGVSQWIQYARVVRAQVLAWKEREFVLAARSLGASDSNVVFRHLLPNIVNPVIVIASFSVSRNILAEAALSFLGLGVEPRIPTWGSMLADGRTYLQEAWWLSIFPGGAITLVVLSVNIVGDWLRDYLDPRLRRSS